MKMHNIQSAIPRTDQTDASKFPPYEFQEFPKMLLDEEGKNVTNGQGEPMVFEDEDQVEAFLEANPKVKIKDPNRSAIDRLDQENEVIRKLLAENEALKARLAPDEEVDEEKTERIAKNKRRGKARRSGGRELKALRN